MAVELVHSELLAAIDGVAHGFTTRDGGISPVPYSSLNLAGHIGDARERVQSNRQRVLEALQRPDSHWISLRQVHGADVVQVNHLAGRNIEADGLWTCDPEAVLAVLVADCVPILMASPDGTAVAAVHAGWRGTRARIVATMVKRLKAAGHAAEDLRVALGPAIGPCCFTIGTDVAEALRGAYPGATDAVYDDGGRMVADLWALNRRALLDAGVRDEHIDSLRTCTACTPTLFSHRRDAGQTGRQAGVIARTPAAPTRA